MSWRLAALVFVGLALIWLLLAGVGITPIQALLGVAEPPTPGLLTGSLGGADRISGTLREMTPVLILGIAVFLALRAGLFNIGAEGQFLLGALACTAIVLRVPGSAGICLGVAGAILAGAAWAWPAGLIKAYRGGHEVITTIMLNSVAGFLSTAIVAGPLRDPTDQSPTTRSIDAASSLPFVYNASVAHGSPVLKVSSGLVLGLLGAVVLGIWLRRTVAGYELRATGANPSAAAVAGVNTRRVIVRAMAASGAISGLAGAVQVLAYEGRFYSGFSPGYGFDALGVALLAGGSATGLIPAALLFGVLAKGGASMQLLGVPKGVTTVILGLLVLIAAAIRYRQRRLPDE